MDDIANCFAYFGKSLARTPAGWWTRAPAPS